MERHQVAYVIGYEAGSLPKRTRPCFISDPKEAPRLVWNEYCSSSLPKYLIGCKDKVGVVVKGCDGRALVELLKERQVNRENVVVVAPDCPGILRASGTGKGSDEILARYCERCISPVSPLFDIRVTTGEKTRVGTPDIHGKNAKGAPQETVSWSEEFQNCVKCLGCIKACPLCYCTECSLDGSLPSLVSKLRIPQELWTFHLVRAMHMAGRCVDCGACEAACPVGIPLTELYRRLNEEVERLFGYVPGLSLESKPPVEFPRPSR